MHYCITCLLNTILILAYVNTTIRVKHFNYDDQFKNMKSDLSVKTARDYCNAVST